MRDPYRGVWGCANARSCAWPMGPAPATIQRGAECALAALRPAVARRTRPVPAEGGMRRAPMGHPNARPPTVRLRSNITA